MCIAILNTKKAGSLPKSHIKNSWDNNDMGAGLLWVESGKLKVFKTYKYDDFEQEYYKIRERKSVGNIVLHFRISTSGFKGEHNLHPFLVSKDLGFVHNGVIKGLGNQKFSDTYEFNDMLKKFGHDFLRDEMSKFLISEYIGYSKLIFLDSKDEFTIVNEELGKWTDDNWYSNDSYKSYNDWSYHGNQKVSKTTTVDYSKDSLVIDQDYELELYLDLCEIYGLDDTDEVQSYGYIEYYMELNNCETMEQLWDLVTDYNYTY